MPPVSEVEPKPKLVQGGSGQLTRADCLCPICLEIFLEPVTLPCEHTFCKPCFLETVDKANMCCPLCRKRVSTWARLNTRKKTLVNVELWKRIQKAFPVQCQRRLNGVEEEQEEEVDSMCMLIPKPKVSEPGELRQEYEDQVSKVKKQAMEEAERRASEEYIQRLLAEEEERIAEERRMQENRQLEEDEQLARLLSEELNSTPVLESHTNVKPNDATSAKKKKPSENILSSPTTLWPCPKNPPSSNEMPGLDYFGMPSTSKFGQDSSEQLSANRANISSKRKTLDTDLAAEDAYFNKRPCGSVRPEPSPKEDILQELALQEEILLSRWQQEEEDRRLAQQLQRELDRESTVDRRKGSADGYLLREKTSPSSTSTSPGEERGNTSDSVKTKAGSVKKSSRAHQEGKTTKKSHVCTQSSPSTPSSSVQRGAKQTTLTDMFPNMGS
uniref:RING-type E3 ubiquitin transferase n=1 Tax=Astyanax mexicanus TaxID=7994 RepID=W5KS43_ASTMX